MLVLFVLQGSFDGFDEYDIKNISRIVDIKIP